MTTIDQLMKDVTSGTVIKKVVESSGYTPPQPTEETTPSPAASGPSVTTQKTTPTQFIKDIESGNVIKKVVEGSGYTPPAPVSPIQPSSTPTVTYQNVYSSYDTQLGTIQSNIEYVQGLPPNTIVTTESGEEITREQALNRLREQETTIITNKEQIQNYEREGYTIQIDQQGNYVFMKQERQPVQEINYKDWWMQREQELGPVVSAAKAIAAGTLNIFNPDYWVALAQGKGGEFIYKQEYEDWKKTQEGKWFEVWVGSQIPAYENVILPLATAGAFRYISAVKAAAPVGSALSKIIPAWQVGVAGTAATIIGADIGTTAAYETHKMAQEGATISKILGISTQFAVMGMGYKYWNVPLFAEPKPVVAITRTYGIRPPETRQLTLQGAEARQNILYDPRTGKTIMLEPVNRLTGEIKTSSAIESPIKAKSVSTQNITTRSIQYSLTGEPLYEFQPKFKTIIETPTDITRFKYTTGRQTLVGEYLPDYRIELSAAGKVTVKEIPKFKSLISDINAESTLLIFKEKPKLSFESEFFTAAGVKKAGLPFTVIDYSVFKAGETITAPVTGFTTVEKTIAAITPESIFKIETKPTVTPIQYLEQIQGKRVKKASILEVESVLKQEQEKIQVQMQKQKQLEYEPFIFSPVSIIETIPKREPTTEFFKPVFLETEKEPIGKDVKGFDTFVKDRVYVKGKKQYQDRFKKVNKFPHSREAALSLGGSATDNSAAATFYIKEAKGNARPLDIQVDHWSGLSNKFYVKDNKYIEKTTFRIDTPGEIKGISALGWIAEKRKSAPIDAPSRPVRVKKEFGTVRKTKEISIPSTSIDISRSIRDINRITRRLPRFR